MLVQLFLVVLTFLLVWKAFKKPDNYPPGLWGLPGIGYLPLGGKSTKERLTGLRKKYGDIVTWRLGTKVMICVFDHNLIKEACQKTDFIDRPQIGAFGFITEMKENAGLITSNGFHWQSMRRFTLRQMRDLGMGKSKIVDAVHEEARYMVETLRKEAGTPRPLPDAYHVAITNIIFQMVAGKRFEADSRTLIELDQMFRDNEIHFARLCIPGFFPWLLEVLPTFVADWITRKQAVKELRRRLFDFMMEFVTEHKKSIDYENQRDFINAYLVEMEKQKDHPDSTMSERDLVCCTAEIFGAGSDTTTNTLKFASLYLANYPNVQRKLQKAVDEGIPKGTLPTLEDKGKLVYVEAFINEVHRYSSHLAYGVMHEATRDHKLGNYFVPKGALLNPILSACHFDPNLWDNPNKFDPDRFLDRDGNLKKAVEGFMPFGIGKRQCPGEALARVELFIFVTALAQNFNFSPPPGKDKVDIEPVTSVFLNLPNQSQPILITLRQD